MNRFKSCSSDCHSQEVSGIEHPPTLINLAVDSSESKILALKLQGLVESHESRPSALKLSDLNSALLQAHRHTQVDNASLRQLIGLDTLAASQILRRLRDRSMLELHRAGAQSFHTLGPELLAGDRPGQGNLVLNQGGVAADRGGLPADRGELHPALAQVLTSLGTRPRKENLWQAIRQLCSDQWRSVAWLAGSLNRQPRNLSDRQLSPMVKDGFLERRFPDIPSHREQAYRSLPTPPPAIRANLEREAQP